jgi:pyruvate,water dikinase
VTTEAYSAFLVKSGLRGRIAQIIDSLDLDDLTQLEERTSQVRELLLATPAPDDIAAEIYAAYQGLGNGYVAVRSCGTAEDLAGTSFAGLHDTYLDVRGDEAVFDAVKRCWASLWTARATAYRQRHDFDHFEVQLAVVVQQMVEAEASGVMFTGNPRTAATDEIVINAAWGLGEAVVQGIITPDEFTVKQGPLLIDGAAVNGSRHVLERTLGSKKLEIVRDPDSGVGVVTREVGAERWDRFALADDHVLELAALGRTVTDYYDGYPQDIEWAMTDSTLYLLQSRPITGVDFAWDADMDAWQKIPENPFVLRGRGMADEAWNGAVTPLMYSWRCETWNVTFEALASVLGNDELLRQRPWQYYKGGVFWNAELEKAVALSTPSLSRGGSLSKLPTAWHESVMASRLGPLDYLKQLVRIWALSPERGPYGWFKVLEEHMSGRRPVAGQLAEGLPDSELPMLSDRELEDYIERVISYDLRYAIEVNIPGLFLYSREAMSLLFHITSTWYRGGNAQVFTHLVTGSMRLTATIREHIELAGLAAQIRDSEELNLLFKQHRDEGFFARLEESEEGRRYQAEIDAFLRKSGHRGHGDRDIYFPRYAEDPSIVYRALEAHLKSDDDPMEQERRNARVRDAAFQDVVDDLSRGPLGFAKVEVFKLVHDYAMRFIAARDDEREHIDKNTFANRKAFLEVNRRLMARGLVETDRDFWFLTRFELFDLLHGRANANLARWKIEGRKRNFDRYRQKDVTMPKFLLRNHAMQVDDEAATTDQDGNLILRGAGTSAGQITGTARVVKELSDIGRVAKGEILIANSTDPGWTPVFAAISGVVVETGGLLSHSGCLAREYGFPAAQIENAVTTIPDGATISLNGDIGEVRVLANPEQLVAAPAGTAAAS